MTKVSKWTKQDHSLFKIEKNENLGAKKAKEVHTLLAIGLLWQKWEDQVSWQQRHFDCSFIGNHKSWFEETFEIFTSIQSMMFYLWELMRQISSNDIRIDHMLFIMIWTSIKVQWRLRVKKLFNQFQSNKSKLLAQLRLSKCWWMTSLGQSLRLHKQPSFDWINWMKSSYGKRRRHFKINFSQLQFRL